MFDTALRHPDDERALGLLRLARAGRPLEHVASELLRLSRTMDDDAAIAAEAVHIAAEASTDGSYEDAAQHWERLLADCDAGSVALSFSANHLTVEEFSARRGADPQWHQFKVLAGSS
jgi:hypothetical protein